MNLGHQLSRAAVCSFISGAHLFVASVWALSPCSAPQVQGEIRVLTSTVVPLTGTYTLLLASVFLRQELCYPVKLRGLTSRATGLTWVSVVTAHVTCLPCSLWELLWIAEPQLAHTFSRSVNSFTLSLFSSLLSSTLWAYNSTRNLCLSPRMQSWISSSIGLDLTMSQLLLYCTEPNMNHSWAQIILT